jgi:hypothetical protein
MKHSQLAKSFLLNIGIAAAIILFALVIGVIAYLIKTILMDSVSEPKDEKPSVTRTVPAKSKRPPDTTNAPTKETTNSSNGNAPSTFYLTLNNVMSQRGMALANVCPIDDSVSRRILEDYGAMFVAANTVVPPPTCIFTNEKDVLNFQGSARPETFNIGGIEVQLQSAAMRALLAAREEAKQQGTNITPRGADSARRRYEDTVKLWQSRVFPALDYWTKKGRLTKEQADRVRNLPIKQQVAEILELEKQGIYFSKDLSKSILYSIAAPGSSQHISMLALDVSQFADKRVQRIMAKHGWFQTVKSDLPHFTYLGVEEKDLPSLGLRSMTVSGQVFWIPNVEPIR